MFPSYRKVRSLKVLCVLELILKFSPLRKISLVLRLGLVPNRRSFHAKGSLSAQKVFGFSWEGLQEICQRCFPRSFNSAKKSHFLRENDQRKMIKERFYGIKRCQGFFLFSAKRVWKIFSGITILVVFSYRISSFSYFILWL